MDDVEVSAKIVSRFCSNCGAALAAGATHCTRCLLELGLEASRVNRCDDGGKHLRFGDYEIASDSPQLEGGMGVVYRARQISLNRTVALKMIKGGILIRPEQVARFRAEAEAAASLDHPNIVPIYEIGEEDGRQYFTMKWLDGGSLAEASLESKVQSPKSAESAAVLVAKVARAVHHAHQRGFIHRDLKPSNVLRDAAGNPHVSDFGLAKRLTFGPAPSRAQLTSSGDIFGTPNYMAPEQAAGKARDVTTAADVYSLGAILYELLTGQPPFSADTPAAALTKVLTEEPTRPSSISRKIPNDLETICLKCLEKEPGLRYGSAEALAEDLERWQRGEPILARAGSLWGRVSKWARRKPTIASLTGAIFLVAVLGFAGVLWQFQKTRHSLQDSEILIQALKEFLPGLRPGLDDAERTNILNAVEEQLKNNFQEKPAMQNYLLGLVDYSRGDYSRAETEFREAVKLYESAHELPLPELAESLNSLGVMIHKQGNDRRAEAEQMYRRAFKILVEIYARNDARLDDPRRNWAFVLRRLQRFGESETLYREAWQIEQHRHGQDSEQAAVASLDLLQVLLEEQKFTEAESTARLALSILKNSNPQSWQYFDGCSLLGGAFLGEGRFAEAEPLLSSGVTGLQNGFSFESFMQFRELEDAMLRMQQYFESIDNPAEAARWKSLREEARKKFGEMMDAKAHKK